MIYVNDLQMFFRKVYESFGLSYQCLLFWTTLIWSTLLYLDYKFISGKGRIFEHLKKVLTDENIKNGELLIAYKSSQTHFFTCLFWRMEI